MIKIYDLLLHHYLAQTTRVSPIKRTPQQIKSILSIWWFTRDCLRVGSDRKYFWPHHMRDFHFVHKFSEENQSLISVPKVHIGISISFWLFWLY